LLRPEKNCFKHDKNKNLAPLKMYFVSPSLKTWLRACCHLATVTFTAAFGFYFLISEVYQPLNIAED